MIGKVVSDAEASSSEVCLVNKDLPRSQIAQAIATTLFDVFADDEDENYPKALADVLINGIILKLENGRKFTTLEEEFLRSDTVKNHPINYKLIKHLRIHGSVDDNPYIREEGGSYFIDTQAILDKQPTSIENSLNSKSGHIEEEGKSIEFILLLKIRN